MGRADYVVFCGILRDSLSAPERSRNVFKPLMFISYLKHTPRTTYKVLKATRRELKHMFASKFGV